MGKTDVPAIRESKLDSAMRGHDNSSPNSASPFTTMMNRPLPVQDGCNPQATDRQRTRRPVVIWGARGHAKVLNEFVAVLGYELVALVDNDPTLTSPFPEVPLHHGFTGLRNWLSTVPHPWSMAALVAIGGDRGRLRLDLLGELQVAGFDPVSVVHPTAFVAADALVGYGTQILANASVCAEARIGNGCIINTKASVDHECVLGNGVHLAPGATLAGCVQIADFSMIAAGAVVLPRRSIGSNSIVGAGSVVTRDIPDNVIAYGNPARVVRQNAS